MDKHYTSLEQSRKLLELGLDPKSADMNWHDLPPMGTFVRAYPYVKDNGATEGVLPCWSVAALLSLYPKIEVKSGIEVFTCKSYGLKDGELLNETRGLDWIETTFKMVIWLLENNHIKKDKIEGDKKF